MLPGMAQKPARSAIRSCGADWSNSQKCGRNGGLCLPNDTKKADLPGPPSILRSGLDQPCVADTTSTDTPGPMVELIETFFM